MDSPDPKVRTRVAQDLVFLHFVGIKVVVVHGGGKEKELEAGLEAKFINGLRFTDDETIDVVDEVLNDQVNAEVAEFVSSYDCGVHRLPGKKILQCEKLVQEPDLGFVGSISKVQTEPIEQALNDDLMRSFPPLLQTI